ncbi:MAG TPA: DUF4389 domain-containing protein [Gaiellaceae bacterium]|nr:DUF4389 domain-containing protein [Gaiellaceae bacterium]
MTYRWPMHEPHPVRLVVEDDYRRTRLTVFFRLLLAIPHYVWFFLWTLLIVITAVLNWLISIFTGRPPQGFHNLMSSYVRYQAHLTAYLALVANPYPGFMGEAGEYPIDIRLPEEPVAQRRWTVFLRLLLTIPALLVASALAGLSGGNLGRGRNQKREGTGGGALLLVCAVLGWFASLVQGRMPKGLRDAGAYSIGYTAQATAYLLLVTDRYPNADPTEMLVDVTDRPPRHPVRVVGDPYDLRRSRLTVFFRILLSLPHLVWLVLWSILVFFAVIAQWFVTLFRGTPAGGLHRFLTKYVRYRLHVYAYLMLVANPFPGFTGAAGTYPLDLEVEASQRQNRWKTGFRIILAIPGLLITAALGGALFASAVLTWFYALVKGSAPWGLRNLSAYALRYDSQVEGYLLLLTDSYPHASPLEGDDTPVE